MRVKVISVNPAKQTPGAFWVDGLAYTQSATRSIAHTVARTPKINLTADRIFGTRNFSASTSSLAILGIRILVAAAFIAAVIIFSTSLQPAEAAILFASAACLSTGFMCRPAMIASSAYFFYMLFSNIVAGVIVPATTMITAAAALTTLLVGIAGPGLFSADQLIIVAAKKIKINREKKRKKRRMSYRAFSEA